MSVEEAVAWIEELRDGIWVKKFRPLAHLRRGESSSYWELVRTVTEDELGRVLQLVAAFDLPTTLHNSEWGFNVAMTVWGPEPPALYPGVELAPKSLLMLPARALPPTKAEDGRRVTFDDAWAVFEPHTHSEKNRELLRRCSLPNPPTRGDLAY